MISLRRKPKGSKRTDIQHMQTAKQTLDMNEISKTNTLECGRNTSELVSQSDSQTKHTKQIIIETDRQITLLLYF